MTVAPTTTLTTAAPLSTYPVTRNLLGFQVLVAGFVALFGILPIWRSMEMGEFDTFLLGVGIIASGLIWMSLALVGLVVLDIADNTRKQAAKGGAA